MVIGAWFVHYLIVEGGVSPTAAGLLAFVVFAVSAVGRDASGQLLARGAPQWVLSFGGMALGAAGVVVLAVEPSVAGGLASAALMGIGLSLPYAVVYEEGVRVLSDSPVGGLGITQATANLFPVAVTPLLGAAIAGSDGELAWLALAVFILVGGMLNIRPAVPATEP